VRIIGGSMMTRTTWTLAFFFVTLVGDKHEP
jgi:hypothetical protein